MNVVYQVTEVFREHVGPRFTAITPDTVVADLPLDALDHIEIAIDLEDQFDVFVPDDLAGEYRTIGNLCECLEGQIAG